MYEVINLRNKWNSDEEFSPNKYVTVCPNTPNVKKKHVKMKEQ